MKRTDANEGGNSARHDGDPLSRSTSARGAMQRVTVRLIWMIAVVALLCVLKSGVGVGQSAHANARATAYSAPSRTLLSAGCGKMNAAKGAFTVGSSDGRGKARTYLMQVPADYDPRKTYSLALVFHGKDNTAEGSRAWGLQNAPGAAGSAIFVFPQGVPFESDGVGWDVSNGGYDMAFFDTMVREVEWGYCIDTEEVFVTGFSWGGDFSVALECRRGDTIRAVATNSATDDYKDQNDYRTFQNWPCPGDRHPAVRFEHAVDTDGVYLAPSFATTSKLFQYLDHCSATAKPLPASTPVMTCHTYENCATPYVECPYNRSIGHALPPNWASDTWAFFASFRKADRDVAHYR